MQIVINIDENIFTRLFDNGVEDYEITNDDLSAIAKSIRKGVLLPQGHGDLIDRRELKKEVYTSTEWNGDIHRIVYEASIDDAKPIIEAEKGEE